MSLSLYSPLWAVAAITVAWLTAHVLTRIFGAPPSSGRYATIDGLRGFLAFAVFMHHSVIWFVYLRTGSWEAPPSRLFHQFGDTAVALFFMITAFLFTSKVINSDKKPVEWTRLYVGRFMRLFPMYAVAVGIMLLLVLQMTGWHRRVAWPALVDQVMTWVSFTVRGHPDVNSLPATSTLIAGVTWSLPYEWWFYLSLPILALLTRRKAPAPALILGAVTVLLVNQVWGLQTGGLLPFVGGIVSAWLVRDERFRALASRRIMGVVVILAVLATVLFTQTAYSELGVALLFVAFALISAGNDLFGVLSSGTSRLLGEVTYSMYLIHGLLLTVAFVYVFGAKSAAQWSPFHHWLVILALAPVLVVLSYCGFRLIEMPGQRLTPPVTRWLTARWAKLSPVPEQPEATQSQPLPVPEQPGTAASEPTSVA
jgi:peptidoglycan/LPS O-acetylase OafA/YrhL